MRKPNFVAITSEHFNGGSGDMVALYDVAKFAEKIHTACLQDVLLVIEVMENKSFIAEAIVDEIKKQAKRQLVKT